MKSVVLGTLLILLGGCHQSTPPKDAIQRISEGPLTGAEFEQIRKDLPGMTALCVKRLRAFGIGGLDIPLDRCFEMTPQRRWTGLWRNQFEGSQFCPAPARECPARASSDDIWLTFADGLSQNKMEPSGGLYAVEFVGRRTIHEGVFGHLGMSNHEMIVDRVISIKQVEAPPPPPTKAETIEYWKRCEAAGNCFPDWEQINNLEE